MPLHSHHQPSIASLRPSPSQVLAGPRYQLAAEFALHLVQQCCVVEPVRCWHPSPGLCASVADG